MNPTHTHATHPIILLGGGGHCLSCIDVIEQAGLYTIVGILDQPERVGTKVMGYPIIGSDDDIPSLVKTCPSFLITVGQIKSATTRRAVYQKVKTAGGQLPIIISPLAYVSPYANLGEGTIVMHQALVNVGATVGRCCIVNTKALIEHETTVGDFSHISTGACLNGQVNVGEDVFVGSNAVVGNNLSIADKTVLSARSQVLKNIKTAGVYHGFPLRKIG
jgi:sugar O-acyltransferase (sialic acid O-acetyltransferase NeuD family)